MEIQTQAAHFMDRVLDPLAASLNREAARSILEHLASIRKFRPGSRCWPSVPMRASSPPTSVTSNLEDIEAADLVAIFKLKARRHLEANGTA